MYKHEEGSYAYCGYSRLPFDQSLLVATLAPDRAIIIYTNLNDYNDSSIPIRTRSELPTTKPKALTTTIGEDTTPSPEGMAALPAPMAGIIADFGSSEPAAFEI